MWGHIYIVIYITKKGVRMFLLLNEECSLQLQMLHTRAGQGRVTDPVTCCTCPDPAASASILITSTILAVSSSLLFSSPLHFFSSVSVITSICFLCRPALSLPLAHFPPLIPAAYVRELFPTSSSSHFSSGLLHADKHGLQSLPHLASPPPPAPHPALPRPCLSVAQMHLFNTSSKQISRLLSATGRR